MATHPIDTYLLEGRPSKGEVIAALLRERVADPRAAAFYRALEAVGAAAADESLVALRLVLAGSTPDDHSVRRLRGLAAISRAAVAKNSAAVHAAIVKDPEVAADAQPADDLGKLARAVRERYEAMLATPGDVFEPRSSP